jgi:hypothetical protein
MRRQSRDTDAKIEALLASMLRDLSTSQKFAQIRSLTETTILLSRRALQRKHPGISVNRLNQLFVELHYGKELAGRFRDYIENQTR